MGDRMTWTTEQIAKTIDHAVLKPTATDQDVRAACRMAREHKIACVCVHPLDVKLAKLELQGGEVKTGTVVGFPHGIQASQVKAHETRLALADGADEIDMVMNIGRFLSGDDDFVRKDIEAVVAEAKKNNAVVKVIIETPYLNDDQITRACKIVTAAGADFVKTSTGFADGPATLHAVKIMTAAVAGRIRVKAAGGIRTRQQAIAFLDLGCARLGASATAQILEEKP
jgi:deoxyribose-phosphate aldolase